MRLSIHASPADEELRAFALPPGPASSPLPLKPVSNEEEVTNVYSNHLMASSVLCLGAVRIFSKFCSFFYALLAFLPTWFVLLSGHRKEWQRSARSWRPKSERFPRKMWRQRVKKKRRDEAREKKKR